MCGRYTLTVLEGFPEYFEIDEKPSVPPLYNISPTQNVPVVRVTGEGNRELDLMHWGLIPNWADSRLTTSPLINARSETVERKPSFRDSFRLRRCLIPSTGFYEWKREDRIKQPYYFKLRSSPIFAFAGIWDWWDGEAERVLSCTILTTVPNDLVGSVHNRMPVILKKADHGKWMGADSSPQELNRLLAPFPSEEMTSHLVDRLVNSPRNNGPECIQPIDPGKRPPRPQSLF
jgi:putative SOS response-associated peptidase YedK